MSDRSRDSSLGHIVGSSPALGKAREVARQAAQDGTSVVIVGESGTGKELFARAIHAVSHRRHQPFLAIDCSPIPREQLEADLFGGTSGTFTGAARNGKGKKSALARAGTIFLDEIGAMPLATQGKLLRGLQERQLLGVCGASPQPVVCGVIAATARDPETLVAQGRLRRDLCYRLDVVRIVVPPLRERPEDIPLLLAHYWRHKSQDFGLMAQLSANALRILETYPWPRNVRELIEVVEHLLRESRKLVLEPEDLPAPIVAAAERWRLTSACRLAQGNHTKAARLLGMARTSFYRKLKAHGLLDPDVV
jgi:transcriptional regulator with PAS, ATPase and Fis domain